MVFIKVLLILYQIVSYMMNKYLKTENASITIEFEKNLISKFFEENCDFLDNSGLQRLFIECNANELKNIYDTLKEYNFKNITIFIKVKKYNDNYIDDLIKINEILYTIICCNINEFSNINYNEECYYELNFNYDEIDKVTKIISKYDNILLNINYDLNKIKEVNNTLENITMSSISNTLNFSNLFLEKELIYSCPYNIYLNNENSNRTYGNNIPRNIFIDLKGNVYCICIKCLNIVIGNINDKNINSILKECKNHTGYKNFIKYNENLFVDYLNQCPYQVIDYIAFLNEVIQYNE